MKKWTVSTFQAAKGVRRLGCCTAYDACFARLADEAGVPCILVGDSMGMTVLGHPTTLPVKMEETLSATAAVARAVKEALVVADMPFGSFQCGDDLAMANAVECLKAGADAVKIEGGERICPLVRRMADAGIPVLGHVGLTPQSVNAFGGFKFQGKTPEAARAVFDSAVALQDAGAFAVTLECVPGELASKITAALRIPTVGIGAGPDCDAQWLVMHDLLGLNEGHVPSFAKRYANLAEEAKKAFGEYVREVADGAYPPARRP